MPGAARGRGPSPWALAARDHGQIGQAGIAGEELIHAVQTPGLSLLVGRGDVGTQVAAALRLRHPGSTPGLPGKQRLHPRFLLRGVLVNDVGGLVGDNQAAVQPGVSQQESQGEMVMPGAAFVGRAVDEGGLLEGLPVRRAEQSAIDAHAVHIVHHQLRRAGLIDMIADLVGRPAGEGAESVKFPGMGRQIRPVAAQHVAQIGLQLPVILAEGIGFELHGVLPPRIGARGGRRHMRSPAG
jgi:hypothetical protein